MEKKNISLNGGEVDMDIRDKDDKKIKESNEKDKIQENEVVDEKIIDNDEYKLELEPRDFFNIIMEYSPIGSLKEERTKRIITGNGFKEEEISYYLYQICCWINEIHSKKMYHGNLKLSNVLIFNKALKITDFSKCKILDKKKNKIEAKKNLMKTLKRLE